jgi:hypothetical protein
MKAKEQDPRTLDEELHTRPVDAGGAGSSRHVLVIDVGGTHVKVLASGQDQARSFVSGPTLTPKRMVVNVRRLVADWKYDVISN